MNRRNQILIVSSLIGALACSSLKPEKKYESSPFKLEINASPCFGRCPAYTLIIDNEGNTSYEGLKYPRTNGKVERVMSKSDLDSIRLVLDENQFWDLDSIYDNPQISDLPSLGIQWQSDSKKHKVTGRFNTPEGFDNIAAFIERLRLRNFGDLK